MDTLFENAVLIAGSLSSVSHAQAIADFPAWLFAAGVLTAAGACVLLALRPRPAFARLARLLAHALYRIDRRALTNVPREGAALLVANHVSFVDALLIAGLSPRPVRFVMDARIHDHWLLKPLFKAMGTIPILPGRVSRSVLSRAHDHIAGSLEKGELVCIFPEGGLTRDGRLAPFRSGVEQIVARTPVPVVPIALDGLWGSMFSRAGRRQRLKGFRRRLRIVSARPVPPEAVRVGRLEGEIAALLELRPENTD